MICNMCVPVFKCEAVNLRFLRYQVYPQTQDFMLIRDGSGSCVRIRVTYDDSSCGRKRAVSDEPVIGDSEADNGAGSFFGSGEQLEKARIGTNSELSHQKYILFSSLPFHVSC